MFVIRNESALCTLEASTTKNRDGCFNPVQGLSSILTAALRALPKKFSEKICSAVISWQLYSMTAKNEREYSKRLDRRLASLLTRLDSYRARHRDGPANRSGRTATAKESRFSFKSGFDFIIGTVYVSQSLTKEHVGSSLVSLRMSAAAAASV